MSKARSSKPKSGNNFTDLPGWLVRYDPAQEIKVVELDFTADPDKRDKSWAQATRRRMKNERNFQREFMRNWSIGEGDTFYPEYTDNGADDSYVVPSSRLLRDASGGVTVYRGWDFGYRHPACVWFQVSPTRRVWVIRELMPFEIDVTSFRDLVKYLSGQLALSGLTAKGLMWAEMIAADKSLPMPPWFQQSDGTPINYVDFGGHEATIREAMPTDDSKERTQADILEAGGIVLQAHYTTVKRRETVMRDLLCMREDGWPGIVFDPSCRTLIAGMNGGIVFAKATEAKPRPEEPKKDGKFEHLHEALGYGLVQTVPAVDEIKLKTTRVFDDGVPMDVYDDGTVLGELPTVGFYETRKDQWSHAKE